MDSKLRNRLVILAVVLIAAALFIYPTVRLAIKKVSGQEISSADTSNFKWLSKPISLGLDLSGGVHLVYRVETDEAVKGRLQTTAANLRNELRKQKIAVTRAVVNPAGQVEVSLLSNRSLEQTKTIITDLKADLQLVGTEAQGDGSKLIYGISDQQKQTIKDSSVEQAIETLRSRVDQFGVSEPQIQKIGSDRVLLQMPGVQDIESVKKVVGRVAKLEFRLLPAAGSPGKVMLKDKQGSSIEVEDVVQMGGESIQDARVGFDYQNQVEVGLTFNSDGAKTFGSLTGSNVGRNLAIILDGVVYSSPVIREKIAGGQCSISGSFGMEEAKELAVVLRAGALPAPLTVMEERLVGPTLGAESIKKGVISIVVGFVLILTFMFVYYRKSGLVAAGTLAINILLVLAALSAFGATLTLPGIVGLALTVGMAVDSNVIIFERIRDEIRNGADRDASVFAGFSKAFSAIWDSNLTTLLAGFVLYYFGTGPIRGFAVTLSIGVVTTVFCATFLAHLAFDYFKLKSGDNLSI